MNRIAVALSFTVAAAVLAGAALLWPRTEVRAQGGLPVGVADCACTRGTQLDAGPSKVYMYVCQCGAQQCVIGAGTTAGSSAAPQLAQSCR